MSPTATLCLAAAAAYLVGSIPFGLLVAKSVRGIDVRQHGSGNIGATNVGRVLGRKWGVLCLLLDALKGLAPTLAARLFLPLPDAWLAPATVTCGAAAIAGHVFPVWLGFRGGKGVATGAGVAAVVCWQAALAAVAAFGIVFAAKRVVSLASIVAACAYAIAALVWLREPLAAENLTTAAFSVAIPALIIARHRDNIRRLLRGEERRFTAADEPSEPVAKT